jgi:hypothetical protein
VARVAIVTSELLVDVGDRWELGFGGGVIDRCCFDYAVVLHMLDGSSRWDVRLEQPFAVTTSDGTEHLIVPEEAVHIDQVLTVLRSTIEQAVAFKDGHLELRVSQGAVLQAPPNEGFEAWTVTGPHHVQLVCLPGGEVAVWSPDHEDGSS